MVCKSFTQSVPFNIPIQGGLQDGMSITVCGRVWPNYGSDVILHFNPRYEGGSGFVVHNTNQKGVWGKEEREYKTPVPRGQAFALQILVTQESYKVTDTKYNYLFGFFQIK
uniref:Galectin n=1 Tax=Sinocyclocheilus grahami TaxID=75366 RepID=A0A672NX08_SINGR